jgi:hypothetical protein
MQTKTKFQRKKQNKKHNSITMRSSQKTLAASLLAMMLALDNAPSSSALNLDALDTPLLDAVASFFCGDNAEDQPLCSLLGMLSDDEEGEGGETNNGGEDRVTLGEFLLKVGCDTSVMPEVLCETFLEDDEEESDYTEVDYTEGDGEEGGKGSGKGGGKDSGGKGGGKGGNKGGNDTDERTMVDGLLLGLLCGDNGYAPEPVCQLLVGEDGNSGVIRYVMIKQLSSTSNHSK